METSEFFAAVETGDVEAVRIAVGAVPELLRVRLDQRRGDATTGATAVHVAVHANQPQVIRALAEAGADLDARTEEGRTPLHDSLECNDRVRALLLELGSSVDICAAAFLDDLDRVNTLLDGDGNLANDRSTHLSPLGWASYSGAVAAARLLLRLGARLDDGELLCAASVNGTQVGRVLLDAGARPDEIISGNDANALHAAAAMRYSHDTTAFIGMLLEAGADVSIRTAQGKTALQIARAGVARQEKAGTAQGERKAYAAAIDLLEAAAGDG